MYAFYTFLFVFLLKHFYVKGKTILPLTLLKIPTLKLPFFFGGRFPPTVNYRTHTILENLDSKARIQQHHKCPTHGQTPLTVCYIKQYLKPSTLVEPPSKSPGSISKSSGDSKSSRPCINPKALMKIKKYFGDGRKSNYGC